MATPVLSNPLAASWDKLAALSAKPGEGPLPAAPAPAPVHLAPAPRPAEPAAPRAAFASAAPSLRVPGFRAAEDAQPASEPAVPSAVPAWTRAQARSAAPAPEPEPAFPDAPSATYRARSAALEDEDELLASRIERAILEELRPVIEAAARRAADIAADRIERDFEEKAGRIVREAVARELPRALRNR